MADETQAAPSLEDYPARSHDKLRFADTDQLGHVNNAVFSTLLETGRAEILYPDGKPLAAPGATYVIVKVTLEFLAELNYPGRIDIGTRVVKIGRSSVSLQQGLFQDGKLAGRADTVIVQIDETSRRSAPLPPETLSHLRSLMDAADR